MRRLRNRPRRNGVDGRKDGDQGRQKLEDRPIAGRWRYDMTLGTILLIILILILVGAIPSWPHSRSWGYGPSGIVGVLLIIIIILLLTGRL
jgi:hypothetical protein